MSRSRSRQSSPHLKRMSLAKSKNTSRSNSIFEDHTPIKDYYTRLTRADSQKSIDRYLKSSYIQKHEAKI